MSWGYIKQYLTLIEQNTKTARNFQFKYFLVEWNKTKTIRIKIELIKKGIRFVRMWIGNKCVNIIKRLFRRGHSTIEMQLFRTLSYKSGIKVGKPGNTKEIYNMLMRKLYEVVFTHIFFYGLRKYLIDNGVIDISRYKFYIMYLYVHTVITWYKSKRYMPMSDLFEDKPICQWNIEKLFIATLGLSQKKSVDEKRVELYSRIINKYNLSMEEIINLIV